MSRDRSTIITEIVLDTLAERLRDDSAFRGQLRSRLRGVFEDWEQDLLHEIRLHKTNEPDTNREEPNYADTRRSISEPIPESRRPGRQATHRDNLNGDPRDL